MLPPLLVSKNKYHILLNLRPSVIDEPLFHALSRKNHMLPINCECTMVKRKPHLTVLQAYV